MKNLISVIMSTYNEPISMIEKSINSILMQTYPNIQLVLINDNPERIELGNYLTQIANDSAKIKYLANKKNMGLVYSLNCGLRNADGDYIARMDADDISHLDRIEKQVKYLKENDLDIIGSYVRTIDDYDNVLGSIKVPRDHNTIVRLYKYGSCLLHPTWFCKKEVFEQLNGYRNIYACEDYDFITRCIKLGFKFGNIAFPLLDYRIRENGISVSSEAQQKLMMYYISKNRDKILSLNERDFANYLISTEYTRDLKYINRYIISKNKIKKQNQYQYILTLIFNKFFYINLISKMKLNNKSSQRDLV
ncbi:glycosyltransferase [Mediterraneibacter faecis]|uniref:glycosyltransferase n=1 Tax=Mediterraneibacter faecis TaxID=592978 RepID=UPI0032C0E524